TDTSGTDTSGTDTSGTDTNDHPSTPSDNGGGTDTTHNGGGNIENGGSGHSRGGGSCQGEGGPGELYEVGGALVCVFNGPQKKNGGADVDSKNPCENDVTWGGRTWTIFTLIAGRYIPPLSAFWDTLDVVNCLKYLQIDAPPKYE
ncbi:hypothetical protein ACFW2T_14365, partial [Streptomyces sp. NPDC058892]